MGIWVGVWDPVAVVDAHRSNGDNGRRPRSLLSSLISCRPNAHGCMRARTDPHEWPPPHAALSPPPRIPPPPSTAAASSRCPRAVRRWCLEWTPSGTAARRRCARACVRVCVGGGAFVVCIPRATLSKTWARMGEMGLGGIILTRAVAACRLHPHLLSYFPPHPDASHRPPLPSAHVLCAPFTHSQLSYFNSIKVRFAEA